MIYIRDFQNIELLVHCVDWCVDRDECCNSDNAI